MQNQNNTNTTNTNTATTAELNIGGSDVGGLNRQLLGQQAEILSKIEIMLENQNRLELALQAAILVNGTVRSSDSRNGLANASF